VHEDACSAGALQTPAFSPLRRPLFCLGKPSSRFESVPGAPPWSPPLPHACQHHGGPAWHRWTPRSTRRGTPVLSLSPLGPPRPIHHVQVSSWRSEDQLWTLTVSDAGLTLTGPEEAPPSKDDFDPVALADLPQGLPLVRPFKCSPAGVKVVLDPGQPCRFTLSLTASALAGGQGEGGPDAEGPDDAPGQGAGVGVGAGAGAGEEAPGEEAPTTAASVAAFISSVSAKATPGPQDVHLAVRSLRVHPCTLLALP
jgi:hypothetical protein